MKSEIIICGFSAFVSLVLLVLFPRTTKTLAMSKWACAVPMVYFSVLVVEALLGRTLLFPYAVLATAITGIACVVTLYGWAAEGGLIKSMLVSALGFVSLLQIVLLMVIFAHQLGAFNLPWVI